MVVSNSTKTKNTSNHKDYNNNQISSKTTNNNIDIDIKKQVLSPDEIRKML